MRRRGIIGHFDAPCGAWVLLHAHERGERPEETACRLDLEGFRIAVDDAIEELTGMSPEANGIGREEYGEAFEGRVPAAQVAALYAAALGRPTQWIASTLTRGHKALTGNPLGETLPQVGEHPRDQEFNAMEITFKGLEPKQARWLVGLLSRGSYELRRQGEGLLALDAGSVLGEILTGKASFGEALAAGIEAQRAARPDAVPEQIMVDLAPETAAGTVVPPKKFG